MANYWLRCNLSSAKYPFATEFWGRSIILHQQDQNYDTSAINLPGVVIDKGIPQAFYMHNCLPSEQGYASIGYVDMVPALPGSAFGDIYQLQTASGGKFLFCPAGGLNYIYRADTGVWKSTSPFATGTVDANVQVTTAFVHGETYIMYANYKCFIYDDATDMLVDTALTGLTIANIIAICAANNYMIAITATADMAWSSVPDPTDFTPSITTGAGGGTINEAKGNSIVCLNVSGGFFIYCDGNIVFAKYTGNLSFPFVTKEVSGSGGVSSLTHITWQTNLSTHYAWTSAGLQEVGTAAAQVIYSEFSDFIANKIFEDFDETTKLLTVDYVTTQLYLSLKVIEERFLIMSYGKTFGMYTHAIVYDLALKRYGKFKINHVAVFEWNFPNFQGLITYGKLINTTYGALSDTTYGQLSVNISPPKTFKQSICFVRNDGLVRAAVFDASEVTANGVLIIGKFQMDRNDMIEHQGCAIDTIGENNSFTYSILPTLDGKTFLPAVPGYLAINGLKTRTYQKMVVGQNISSLFMGAFNLNSFVINLTLGGSS